MDDEAVRLKLHVELERLFPDVNIYYMPPGDMFIDRPSIIYEPKGFDPSYANNAAYVVGIKFQVTVLSDIPGYANVKAIFDLVALGMLVSSGARYVKEDVQHDVFSVSINNIT